MPDYHKMYLHLFNEVTRAINILQDAQANAEEMYISATESAISLSENPNFKPATNTEDATDEQDAHNGKTSNE